MVGWCSIGTFNDPCIRYFITKIPSFALTPASCAAALAAAKAPLSRKGSGPSTGLGTANQSSKLDRALPNSCGRNFSLDWVGIHHDTSMAFWIWQWKFMEILEAGVENYKWWVFPNLLIVMKNSSEISQFMKNIEAAIRSTWINSLGEK